MANIGSNGDNGMCSILTCFPNTMKAFDKCQNEENKFHFLLDLLGQMCKWSGCDYNFPLPLPPNLKKIDFTHINAFSQFSTYNNFKRYKHVKMCLYENNNIEWLDASNLVTGPEQMRDWSYFRVTGLKKLRYINLNHLGLPPFHPDFFLDVPSLEEVQISGNHFSMDNHLSRQFFSSNSKLHTINISYANVESIDTDAFVDLHKLEVLDVRGNSLTNDSFVSDLKSTNISRLYLNHNALTQLSKSMLVQLEGLSTMHIDLSGNPLICDCGNVYFVDWVQRVKDKIHFINGDSYTCAHSSSLVPLMTLDVAGLKRQCDSKLPIINAVLTTLAIVAITILFVVAYFKRWHIKTCIYRLQRRFKAKTNKEEIVMCKYDAFVLYSGEEEDRLWVHRVLLETLEK